MQIPKNFSFIFYNKGGVFLSRVLLNANNEIQKKYSPFFHRGVDVVKYKNKLAEIIAHSEGIVVVAEYNKRYGKYIKIKHNNGMFTLYGHLEKIKVKVNEHVNRGKIIGTMGKDGKNQNRHLHFEIRNKKDKRINPTKYLNTDLPNNKEKNKIYYQVYDNKKQKWLKKASEIYDYAGNIGNPIGAINIKINKGNIKYRVHNKKWGAFVLNEDDYAGNIGEPFNGIEIYSDDTKIWYRVHLLNGEWMPWINKEKKYNGIIDGIQVIIKDEEDE